MSLVFSMPFIERTVFQYALRDKCLKEIVRFENTQDISINAKVHPKHSMTEARDLLRCFAKK